MDDVQSWPEVPSIAHFCSLFRAAFNLLDFDIEELEEALLTDGAEDAGSSLLQELIVRLLCGCIQNNEISTFNYQMFLRRLFRQKCQEYGRENPFNTDIDFQFLPLRVKVEILHALCDFRLDAVDVPDLLKNLESDSLRVEPLGFDENKSAYWYFYGTRLYREDFPKAKKKIKERKKRRKEDKRRRPSSDSDCDVEESGAGVWQVVCFTEDDWTKLAAKLKGSTCKAERDLYRTLVEDFIPEIPRLFAQKEQQQRKRSAEYQPRTRRQSTRLGKLKQREWHDHVVPRDDDDRLRLERRRERRERLNADNLRQSSESDWEESLASEPEVAPVVGKEGRPAGRQTNNSLSSAMGQIIIRPPKRKKLRSKQVFKTSAEDMRTGMYKILEYVKGQKDAWPFALPVDENYAPRYYSVIRQPMSLGRMEEKLDAGDYKDLNHFREDFQLIVDNCRQYNGSGNEYTDMVTKLSVAFNEAVNRYLEPDPSSDEEVAVDFTDLPRQKERKHREHKDSVQKRFKVKRRKRDREKVGSMSGSESDRPVPSLKSQRERSSVSDNDGSVPGSDFDDREPDFLRETSPPRLEKAESDSDTLRRSTRRPGRRRHRRDLDIDDLDAATEETLKSVTSMLANIPLPCGFSSRSNSPNQFMEDFPTDPRPAIKPERPFRNPRDTVRRRKPIDLLRNVKRKDIRTIDRLQPGKSKGNLLGNISKPKDYADDGGASLGLSHGRASKEGRNALLVKTDVAGPKLSLGTVLKNDILDFGKSKHSFDDAAAADPTTAAAGGGAAGAMATTTVATVSLTEANEEKLEEKYEEKIVETKSPVHVVEPKLPDPPITVREEDSSINKENDPVVEKRVSVEDKKRDGVKEITNKSAPNASAWFKAFGAPKAPTTVKKKVDPPEPAPVAEEKETTWGVASVPPPAGKRQRKASSSSSMSEPSSLSQDSPLHPVSPGLVSPRGEPPPPPINGTLRVGFYQDMSSVHKSSPEKQSPRSTHSSPREISNPSPFQGYSHVYPPSSPGAYGNYSVQPLPSPQPPPPAPPQLSQPQPTSIYETMPQYSAYSDQYRQRAVENYSYKPPEPTPKPNPSIFPVKKRIYQNVDMTPKEPPPPVTSMYKDMADRYTMENPYQQRPLGQYAIPDEKALESSRMHQPMSDPMQNARLAVAQSDLTRLGMPPQVQEEQPRYHHPDMMAMTMPDGKPKYPGSDRNLNAMLESLGRIPSPAHGFPSSLERLMQPAGNTIQEDSDGVFRNKFSTDSAYAAQRHQPPVSSAYPSSNLSHMVDRYEDDRLAIPSPYYDKNPYLKNVASTSSLPMYQDHPNAVQQPSFELNIPKHRDPKSIKKKKGVKSPDTGGNATAFQYVGLKPNEPCATVPPISLKTTGTLPGSAFNYGPGLSNPLYSEGYLDELRQPTAYYSMDKPPFLPPPARTSSYPIPQYMGHQPAIVDGYQQYIQRVQEEQFRQSLAYPPGYHPALGIRPTYERPSWL